MSNFLKKGSKTAGLPPGALMHIGERKTEKVKIAVIEYNETHFKENEVKSVEKCFPLKEKPTVTWINISGLHEGLIIEKIGTLIAAHPLVLEDIMNTSQRPKTEDFEEYLFTVLKMFYRNQEDNEITDEQVSVITGSNYVVSFQERDGDVFNSIRERLRSGKGRIRKMGADYLTYSLIDKIVDNYFITLENIGDKIEFLEEELVENPTTETLRAIHHLKRELIILRKSIWPLRELISTLERDESSLVKETTLPYLRDVYDHTIQVIDTIETFRDLLSGMLDIYLSSISNRMNEVMKVLTIIATIFIPLTLVAGIYGMNFKYMPELEWQWAYPLVILVMIGISFFMLIYFRRKRWL